MNEALHSTRSLADWGFVLAIAFVGAVVFSTIAEKLSRQPGSKSLWNTLKTIAAVLLIGALALEHSGHKRETGILDSEKAELRTTNELLISSNLAMTLKVEQLRLTNNLLEEARLPINIGGRAAFVEALKDGPPTPVFLTTGIGERKGKQTMEQLRFALNTAGWGVRDAYETNEYAPGIVLKANPGQSEKALHVLLQAFLDRNIPAQIMLAQNRDIFPVNAIYIFIGERPHPAIAAEVVLSGQRREAVHALDAYITAHRKMTPNELAEANKLGEEVLKLYVERIKSVAKRGGETNGTLQVILSSGGAVTVSNGIPVGYVSGFYTSGSIAIPFTPMTISNWTRLPQGALETGLN